MYACMRVCAVSLSVCLHVTNLISLRDLGFLLLTYVWSPYPCGSVCPCHVHSLSCACLVLPFSLRCRAVVTKLHNMSV